MPLRRPRTLLGVPTCCFWLPLREWFGRLLGRRAGRLWLTKSLSAKVRRANVAAFEPNGAMRSTLSHFIRRQGYLDPAYPFHRGGNYFIRFLGELNRQPGELLGIAVNCKLLRTAHPLCRRACGSGPIPCPFVLLPWGWIGFW